MQIHGGGLQKVQYLLVVDLEVAAADQVLKLVLICRRFGLALEIVKTVKDVFEGPLHNAPVVLVLLDSPLPAFKYRVLTIDDLRRSLDGEGLPGASLAVCEDRSIIALEAAICYGLSDLLKDHILLDILVRHIVEVEGFVGLDGDGHLVFH